MAKNIKAWEKFNGGISDFKHESPIPNSYYDGISVDVRSEPNHVTILPRTVKESGTVIVDLIKWADTYQSTLDTYMYGDAGTIYKRTSARSYTALRTVAESHGNGMAISAEDNHLYYTTDKGIGRYGSLTSASPQFVDDFFGSQGGVPLNTNSLDLEASSSQYASRADTASLSITGDLSIDLQINPESLPTVGNSMTLVSKWDESGATRSYKFDIYALSGYFGDGSDGALTISSNTTEAPIDSACTGTAGTTTLTATNASFATDQIILIHQSQGTGAGTWMRNKIISYTAGTITLDTALNATYGTGAQVRVLKQHTDVTINNGITYTAKAWNGTVGGILAFIANGTVTVTGTITATGKGFRGGANTDADPVPNQSQAGEGSTGGVVAQTSANGNGGGGGLHNSGTNGTTYGSGGGGGHSSSGTNGVSGESGGTGGTGGGTVGSADLTTMVFGGGGGSGSSFQAESQNGGSGGGIVFITSTTLTVSGSVVSNGNNGTSLGASGGGGGAGGAILLKSQTATLGTTLLTASGGTGATSSQAGGNGGSGRIHLDYYTSYTGTTTPTLDYAQDNNLVTSTTYQMRLSVSADGTALETLTKEFTPITSLWKQVGVTWDASASLATFYLNGINMGTRTGALTAISDNASTFQIGMHKNGAGSATSFYDGLMDEVRIFNLVRSDADMLYGVNQQILVTTSGLVAYYKLNGDVTDATANANNLTTSGGPTYSSSVPFPSPTTRLDIDQTATTTGNTYTTPTTISESATARKTFTPAKDPQKSIAVLVAAKGTGDWTLTVHDTNNVVIASKTVTNALMTTGLYEFVFSSVWRPMTNFTNDYHFHITSTVADGTVTTTTASDLTTVTYTTYYQFLVEDTKWHPIKQFLNFLVIGNERYIAKYEATLYEPNKIVFGAGWRARCFGYWQEYLCIGCMKGENIYDNDQGRVYFWDGYSPTFNFYIDVPEGGVNALLGTRGNLFIWAGYHADLLSYSGGSYASKLKETPLLRPQDYAEVYPGAVTMWMANPRFGLTGNSNSSNINRAVHTWGSTNYRYPEILTCDWPISTGNTGSTVNIGMVMTINQELLISWKDNVSYGVDYVNLGNSPYPTASIQMMVEDLSASYKEKDALQIVATFDPLLSGESINVEYMNEENDTGWNTNEDSPTTGDITIRKVVSNGRFFHMNVKANLTTSVSTSPTLKSLVLQSDTLEGEEVIG